MLLMEEGRVEMRLERKFESYGRGGVRLYVSFSLLICFWIKGDLNRGLLGRTRREL